MCSETRGTRVQRPPPDMFAICLYGVLYCFVLGFADGNRAF